MVHGNLCPENIILNKSGSWKIMGFDFSISSTNPSDAEVCWKYLFLCQSGDNNVQLYCLVYVLGFLLSLSTHVKNGIPTFLHSASLTLSTWPLNTSYLSAVIPPLTCTRSVWSCMPSSVRAGLFSKSTSMTFLRASAGSWIR